MSWPWSLYRVLCPPPRYVWVSVRILRETPKAVLVFTAAKFWIPKSQIRAIRLHRNVFELYVRESILA